jgi:hypothetical protein
MSWIFVDGINEDALYETLELAVTGEALDPHDLGTSRVPLAGAALKSGWCAVFAKYALVMDATVGTNPARLTRLPAKSRCVTCVVLEHAMVSYASLWQDGRYTWQIRHDSSQGRGHLEVRGDLPSAFGDFRSIAVDKQQAEDARRKSGEWGVDYFFDGAWVTFRSTLGAGAALLSTGPALAMLLGILGLAGLAWTARFGGPAASRIARIGLLTWLGHVVLFARHQLSVSRRPSSREVIGNQCRTSLKRSLFNMRHLVEVGRLAV